MGNVVLRSAAVWLAQAFLINNGYGGCCLHDLSDVVSAPAVCTCFWTEKSVNRVMVCFVFYPQMCVVCSPLLLLSLRLRVHPNSVISYLRAPEIVIKDVPLNLLLLSCFDGGYTRVP